MKSEQFAVETTHQNVKLLLNLNCRLQAILIFQLKLYHLLRMYIKQSSIKNTLIKLKVLAEMHHQLVWTMCFGMTALSK